MAEPTCRGCYAATLSESALAADAVVTLPESLAAERKRQGLSLRDTAEQIPGVSFNTLTRIERRISEPTADHVVAVLRWLATDPEAGGERG